MITSLHDKDSSKWQKTTLKHFKNLLHQLCNPIEEVGKDDESGEAISPTGKPIEPYDLLIKNDYLGRTPIFHAVTQGANKSVIAFMKDVMVQGGANEKLLNNIIGNGPALESTGEINNDLQRSNRMIASLYECDIDANAWQYTTAEHVALLVQEK